MYFPGNPWELPSWIQASETCVFFRRCSHGEMWFPHWTAKIFFGCSWLTLFPFKTAVSVPAGNCWSSQDDLKWWNQWKKQTSSPWFPFPLGGREIRGKVVYTSVMNTNSFPYVRERVPLDFCFPLKLYPVFMSVNVDSSLALVLGKKRLRWQFFQDFCQASWVGNSKELLCFLMNSWIHCRSASFFS